MQASLPLPAGFFNGLLDLNRISLNNAAAWASGDGHGGGWMPPVESDLITEAVVGSSGGPLGIGTSRWLRS